ncbi:MAG: hydantoin utilization protein B [Planctomycetes bacterium]|nr:hydantoin utilization protein B [Planctomycetota bacterium]
MSATTPDPILTSVLASAFKAITEEMSNAMSRTTRSPILCEAKDFVTGLYDAEGRMLEQTENLPILSFSLSPVCKHLCERFRGDINEGDVFFHNDVFTFGNQNNDVAAFKPIFHEGDLVAWAAVKGHQADIGGAVAGGYNPGATEVWQEALRIPAIKVIDRGRLRQDVWDLIFANIRLDIVQEDMRAEIGACTVGERRMVALLERHGREVFDLQREELFSATERMMRAEIKSIPDGVYRGEGRIHYDGRHPGSLHVIRVEITVDGDHIRFDYGGTDEQTSGFVNGTYASSASATVLTFLQMVNPDIPHNEGMVRPVTIEIPEGTVLNASYPKATTFGNHLCPPNADAIMRALVSAIPDRVTAGWNHLLCGLSTGLDPRTGDKFVDIGFMGLKGGSGALPDVDGYDHIGMIDASGGVLDQDYEMFEQQTPHTLVEHELLEDSAGAGRQRGGLGVRTRFVLGGEDLQVVTFGDGDVEPAFGLMGGTPGTLNFIELHLPGGEVRKLTSKDLLKGVPAGTMWVQEAGGGGGWGDPRERPAELVATEVENGVVSREQARSAYGVAIDPATGKLDPGETRRLREGS